MFCGVFVLYTLTIATASELIRTFNDLRGAISGSYPVKPGSTPGGRQRARQVFVLAIAANAVSGTQQRLLASRAYTKYALNFNSLLQ